MTRSGSGFVESLFLEREILTSDESRIAENDTAVASSNRYFHLFCYSRDEI